MRNPALLALILVHIASCRAFPADPPAAAEIRTDIIVRDRHSQPVRDLHPDELAIADDGNPVRITALRYVSASPAVSFVFDDLDAPALELARQLALRMATEFVRVGARCSVWRITDRLALVQSFVDDSAVLNRVIFGLTSTPQGQSPPSGEETPLDANARLTLERWRRIAADEPDRPSITAILAIARQQASLSGRKAVVYFSAAALLRDAADEQVRNIAGSANGSAVTIYAVDAATLASSVPPAAPKPDRSGLVFIQLNPDRGKVSPLRRLAEDTGGLLLARARDTDRIVRRVGDDLKGHYEVAYARDTRAGDGRFRSVSVSALRPNIHVQARAGYFALPENAGLELAPFEVTLLDAIRRDDSSLAIPFQARLLRLGAGAVALAVQLPLQAVEYRAESEDEDSRAHYSILAVVRGPDGRILRKFSQDIRQPMPQDLQGVHTLVRHFGLEPGEYRVDVVVQDRHSGRMGRKSFRATLPPPSGLTLGDPFLVYRADRADGLDDPLVVEGQRVVPRLDSVWDSSNRSPAVFLTLAPAAASAAKPKLKLELKQGDRTVFRPVVKLDNPAPGAPWRLMVSLGSNLSPGKYAFVATASQSAATVDSTLEFEVREGSGPAAADSAPSADAISLAFDEPEPALLPGAAPPAEDELKRMLDRARQRASEYRSALPNFLCTRVSTSRMKRRGRTQWGHAIVATEWLQFVNNQENAGTIDDASWGRPSDPPEALKQLRLAGEFGATQKAVFAPEAAADFTWIGMAELHGERVHVFDYRVDRSHSLYVLSSSAGAQVQTGYRGRVYLDAGAMGVRRISLRADGIPRGFAIQESIVSVDYDYLQIAGERTLLPQHAVLKIRRGSQVLKLDRAFRNYRMFTGASEIRYANDLESGGKKRPAR